MSIVEHSIQSVHKPLAWIRVAPTSGVSSFVGNLFMLIFVLVIGRIVCVLSMLALVATRCFALGTQ